MSINKPGLITFSSFCVSLFFLKFLHSVPSPVLMSHMTTQPSNKDKHLGEVDLSPQRHTNIQKKVANHVSAEEKQAQEESHKSMIQCLTEEEECTTKS
jgi:hypothetical protein